MRLRIRVIIFAALAVTCLTAAPALAQEVIQLTGSVNVKDADGSLKPGEKRTVMVSTGAGKQWYDVSASAGETRYRFAGRVETGAWTVSDPAMA